MSPRLRRRTATFEQDLTSPEYDGFAPVLLLVRPNPPIELDDPRFYPNAGFNQKSRAR